MRWLWLLLVSLVQVVTPGGLSGVNVAVTITVPTSATTYDAGTSSTLTVSGSSQSDRSITACTWTNSLGGSGTATGLTSWSIANLPLTVGSNVVTVTCLNVEGTSSNDVLTITRSSASSNPIAAARLPGGDTTLPNTTWAAVGANITNRVTICSSLTSTATSAQINTAISSCSSGGGVVSLGAGTFTLSSGLAMRSNVTLRGQGMSTILHYTSVTNTGNYFYGGASVGIAMQGSYATPNEVAPALATVPVTFRGFSGTNGVAGTYTQGATTYNFASAMTGLSIGDTLVVWQPDDADAAVPNIGFFESSKTGATNAVSWEGSGESKASSMQERVRVTGVSGSQVTVERGLLLPSGTWRTALAPQAGWLTDSQMIHDSGIENMLLDATAVTGDNLGMIGINWARDCWVKGVGLKPKATTHQARGAMDYGIYTTDSRRLTIRDSWIGRMIGGGINTTTSYGIAIKTTNDSLIENNILDAVESPMMLLTGAQGNVFGYNYEHFVGDDGQEGGFQQHQVGSTMNLIEGNTSIKVWLDFFHGPAMFSTYFRNYIYNGGMDLASYHRWHNLVGNVINGSSAYKSLATDAVKWDRFSAVTFRLGYPQQNASSATTNGVALDSVVWTSTMLWGNYSSFDSTSHFTSSEVPSTDPSWPNPVPGSNNLPNSYYKSARPGFFVVSGVGTVAWPMNGPDVTGGTISGLGGHANKSPAQLVYEAAGGVITAFNPTLYGT